jgi:hypothetical protein
MTLIAFAAVACSGTPNSPEQTLTAGIGSEAPTAIASGAPESTTPSAGEPTAQPPAATPSATPPELSSPEAPSGSGPGASILPEVTSFTSPHTASCTSANGTATVGQIHLSWNAVGTAGVRLSIDPPTADTAYDFGFADYPAIGSADVPFACGAPNHDSKGAYHLYVVTTLHDKGYAMYRFAKVYEVTP